jgi:hypothetical protein
MIYGKVGFMKRLFTLATFAALWVCAGCAGYRQETCARALEMRRQANAAPPDQRGVLEAKASGLEEACRKERESNWKSIQESEQRRDSYHRR